MTAQLESRKFLDLTIADDAIAEMAERYMQLVVTSVDDKEGLARVHTARMEVKNARVSVEKKRKELNEEAVAWQRTVNAEAKRVTALLLPIETHLEHEEDIVVREKERIRREAEEQRQAIIRERLKLLFDLDAVIPAADAERMTASEFAMLLGAKTAEKKAREEKAAAEADQRRIETERLAKERAEIDRIRQEQAAAQAKIDAENQRLAEVEAASKRAAELEEAKRAAAERATREAEEKQLREAAAAKAKAEAEGAARVRAESLRPDREKLMAVADAVATLFVPQVSPNAVQAAREITNHLANAAKYIRNTVDAML